MIFEEFKGWVLGIEEEEPLPLEIKYVSFVIDKDNKILMYAGRENYEKTLTSFSYFPLEGQFFNCSDFYKLDNIEEKTLELVQRLLKLRSANFLKNKIVEVGYIYKKPYFTEKFKSE